MRPRRRPRRGRTSPCGPCRRRCRWPGWSGASRWTLPRRVAQDRLDVFHAPCLTAPLRLACPLVVTIHDMIWRRELPRRLLAEQTRPAGSVLSRCAGERGPPRRRRHHGLGVFPRRASREKLALPPERIHVTYEAANARYRPITDARGPRRGARQVRPAADVPARDGIGGPAQECGRPVSRLRRPAAGLAGAVPARHRLGEPASGVRPGRPGADTGDRAATAVSARRQR